MATRKGIECGRDVRSIRACEVGEFEPSLVELFEMANGGVGGEVELHGEGDSNNVEFVTGLLNVKRDCHKRGVRYVGERTIKAQFGSA